MKTYYLAVTYDVCEHEKLFIDMNEHRLDSLHNIDNEVKFMAAEEVAPVVKVFISNTKDFREKRLYKEFTFPEYECGCKDLI